MGGFVVALVIGAIAFWLVSDAIYKPKSPKPSKPQPVTMETAWAAIRSAERTLDQSRKLIYPEVG